ncbi:MAG: hypothetical protein HZB55_07290 [Deltaproteobacteria bacterium]|nr:hypothetical protein [Deltaproteobacteria bacterium]
MVGEPRAASPPRGTALARLALGDLQGLQALALEILARAEGVSLLAREDPASLPLAGEDPFGALFGSEPGGGGGRPAADSRGGRSPALGDLGAGRAAAPEGMARELRPGRGVEATPSPGRTLGVFGAGYGTASSGALPGDIASSGASILGASLGQLVQVLAGPRPAAALEAARREGRAHPPSAAPDALPTRGPVALSAASETPPQRPGSSFLLSERLPASLSVPAPAGPAGRGEGLGASGASSSRAGGRGSETSLVASRGPALPATLWERLGDLADEALVAGDADRSPGAPEDSSGVAPDRVGADGAPRGGRQELRRGAPSDAWPAPGAARAAADLLDRRPPAVAPGPRGGFLPEGRPATTLDRDELAELVNDALVRQARRHGVDLS